MGDTGYIAKVARSILGILCLILMVMGLVLMTAGGMIITNEELVDHYSKDIEDTFLKGLKTAGIDLDTSKFSIAGFIQPISPYLIGFGLVMCLLALLGWLGACNKRRNLLIAFCIIFGLMFGVQCMIIYNVYNNPPFFDRSLKVVFFNSLLEYGGVEATDMSSMAWNGLMITLECCGVDSYKDFSKSTKWPPKWLRGKQVSELKQLKTPIFCCNGLPDLTEEPPDLSCATNPSPMYSWMKTGCYTTAWDAVVNHKNFKMVMRISTSVQGLIVVSSLYMLFIDGAVRKADKKKKQREDVEKAEAKKTKAEKANAAEKAKTEKAKTEKAKTEKGKASSKAKAEKEKAEQEEKTRMESASKKESVVSQPAGLETLVAPSSVALGNADDITAPE